MTPEIEPVRFTVEIADGEMAGWRWANAGAPPLLFCHATGFCASAYKQMLQRLSLRFDIYALDMRGHGQTRLPADSKQLHSWNVYANDIAEALDRLDRKDWTVAGHSLGGVVVTTAAAKRSDVSKVRLIEPVAIPAYYSLAAHTPLWRFIGPGLPMVKQAANRRNEWPDRETVLKSYQRKALFRLWADGVVADYLEDGLAMTAEGVRLSCAPQWEAATFAAHANDFWGAVRAVEGHIAVLVADDRSSTVWGEGRRRFVKYGIPMTKIPEASHLIPMEKPDIAAQFVASP